MNFKLILALVLSTSLFFACKSKNEDSKKEQAETELTEPATENEMEAENPDPAHNSENSLDWGGTYKGTLPCADCPGIEVELTLNSDLTYTSTMEYLERDTTHEEEGKFEWDENGSNITLYDNGEEESGKYKVGENRLFLLDEDGNQIEGELEDAYILNKEME